MPRWGKPWYLHSGLWGLLHIWGFGVILGYHYISLYVQYIADKNHNYYSYLRLWLWTAICTWSSYFYLDSDHHPACYIDTIHMRLSSTAVTHWFIFNRPMTRVWHTEEVLWENFVTNTERKLNFSLTNFQISYIPWVVTLHPPQWLPAWASTVHNNYQNVMAV